MRTFTHGQIVKVRQLYGNLQSATVDGWYWLNGVKSDKSTNYRTVNFRSLMVEVTFTESDASGCHPAGSKMHLSPQFLAR